VAKDFFQLMLHGGFRQAIPAFRLLIPSAGTMRYSRSRTHSNHEQSTILKPHQPSNVQENGQTNRTHLKIAPEACMPAERLKFVKCWKSPKSHFYGNGQLVMMKIPHFMRDLIEDRPSFNAWSRRWWWVSFLKDALWRSRSALLVLTRSVKLKYLECALVIDWITRTYFGKK